MLFGFFRLCITLKLWHVSTQRAPSAGNSSVLKLIDLVVELRDGSTVQPDVQHLRNYPRRQLACCAWLQVVFVTAEGLLKKVTAITDRFAKTNPAGSLPVSKVVLRRQLTVPA